MDVYPNGYEALVMDQPFRLRYWKSLLKAERVEKNKTYPIKIDLWSTALVFNAGHRIEVDVQSSSAPRYEVHSNTWEPVKSYDQASEGDEYGVSRRPFEDHAAGDEDL